MAAAPNDEFAGATAISGGTFSVDGRTESATLEAWEPEIGLGQMVTSGSLWWVWTPDTSGTAVLSPQVYMYPNAERELEVMVVTGTAPGSLTTVAHATGPEVVFPADAGIAYHISVRHAGSGGAGHFWLDGTVLAPPANDDLVGAVVVPALRAVSSESHTFGAGVEAAEPRHGAEAAEPVATVWWRWTAPGSQPTATVVRAFGSAATTLGVFTGNTIGELSLVNGGTESAQFEAIPGTTYQIAVDTPESPGAVSLEISQLPSDTTPSNDAFSARSRIEAAEASFLTSLEHATRERGEEPGAQSLWWEWSPPHSTPIDIWAARVSGEDPPVGVAIYRSSYPNPTVSRLSRLGRGTRVRLSPEPGETYYIRVAGTDPVRGVVDVRFEQAAPSATGDLFADRVPLPPWAPVTTTGNFFGAGREAGEPPGFTQSIWYGWTPPQAGRYVFSASTEVNRGISLAVYSGTSVDALDPLSLLNPGSRRSTVTVDLGSDAPVAVAVSPTNASSSLDNFNSSHIHLTVAQVEIAENDEFATAARLEGPLPVAVAGNAAGASAASSDPPLAGQVAMNTLWWRWTAPSSRTYQFFATDTDARIGVFTGATVAELELVSDGVEHVVFEATGGQDYVVMTGVRSSGDPFLLKLREVGAPGGPNDQFANALAIVESATLPIDNGFATLEPGEHAPSLAAPLAGSVWLAWQAPEPGTLSFEVTGRASPPIFTVYAGDALGSLAVVQRQVANLTPAFATEAGVPYRVAIYERDAADAGPFELTARFQSAPPANDLFADATRLGILTAPVEINGTSDGHSLEARELLDASYSGRASLWWTFSVPVRQHVSIAVSATADSSAGVNPVLAVYSGEYVSRLETVRQSMEGAYSLVPETEYLLRLALPPSQICDFKLQLAPLPPPPNDNIAAAADLGSGAMAEAVVGDPFATFEPADKSIVEGDRGSVWWRWKAPASGRYLLATGAPADAVTRIALFEDISANPLATNPPTSYGQNLEFSAEVGRDYWFSLWTPALNPSGGRYPLSLRVPARPPNDDFAGRMPLPATPSVRVAGSLAGTTPEPGEDGASSSYLRKLWYSWTPPESGHYNLDAAAPDADDELTVGVYTGHETEFLTAVRNGVFLTAGVSYVITVQGRTASDFELQISRVDPAPNDSFSDALPLVGDRVSVAAAPSLATLEPGEPTHRPSEGDGEPVAASRWWRWKAGRSGRVVVTPDLDGIEVYRDSSGGIPGLSKIITRDANLPGDDRVIGVEFEAQAQAVYYLCSVADSPVIEGLEFTLEQAPANDRFHARESLGRVTAARIDYDATLGTSEAGEPWIGHDPVQTLWWTWTAPTSGSFTFSGIADAARVESGLGVFTGGTLTRLLPTAVGNGTLRFDATAGQEYQLALNYHSHGRRLSGPPVRRSGTAWLHLTPPQAYLDWANALAGTTDPSERLPASDPDRDGSPNLFEMAHRTDPADARSAPPPPVPMVNPASGLLELHYLRPSPAALFRFSYESSSDGASWTNEVIGVSVTESTEAPEGGSELVTATFLDPPTSPTLVRIRIELAEGEP